MKTNRLSDVEVTEVEPGRKQRLIHTDALMAVEWEFAGPWTEPDPPHFHPHEQVTYILEGEVMFFLGEEKCHLSAGDMVAVEPDKPHYIQVLTPTVRLIDMFTPLRQEFL